VAVDRTPKLPIDRRALYVLADPIEIFVANAQVSGDVIMCRWGVIEESTIGEKGLS